MKNGGGDNGEIRFPGIRYQQRTSLKTPLKDTPKERKKNDEVGVGSQIRITFHGKSVLTFHGKLTKVVPILF